MKAIIQIFLICLLITSCNPEKAKLKYLESFEKFTIEVEVNADTYDLDDWIEKDSIFKYYAEYQYQIFKSELSSEENERIGELNGKYVRISYLYRAEELKKKVIEEVNDRKDLIKGFMKGLRKADSDGHSSKEDGI